VAAGLLHTTLISTGTVPLLQHGLTCKITTFIPCSVCSMPLYEADCKDRNFHWFMTFFFTLAPHLYTGTFREVAVKESDPTAEFKLFLN
jgi:hypothetical protein